MKEVRTSPSAWMSNASRIVMQSFLLCALIALGVVAFVSAPKLATQGSTGPFGLSSPDTIAVDLLSGSTGRQKSALIAAFYKTHSLAADDMKAFQTLICSGQVADDNHKLFVQVARQIGGSVIEVGVVRQLLKGNAPGAGQACSTRGDLLAAEILLMRDPRYGEAIVMGGVDGQEVRVNREKLVVVAKSRGVDVQP